MSLAALSIVLATFTQKRERNRALGIWGAIGASGAVVGAVLGGVITTYLGSWRGEMPPSPGRRLMTQRVRGSVDELRAAVSGPVIGTADHGYDEARRVRNAGIDRYPAMIARCASPADVATAVTFAAERDLEITGRGGAHSMSGASVADHGPMIDLSELNQVTVDPQGKRAWVGGGALLADLDAAAQAHGLPTPTGLVSHTGVGGLTRGRRHGMADAPGCAPATRSSWSRRWW